MYAKLFFPLYENIHYDSLATSRVSSAYDLSCVSRRVTLINENCTNVQKKAKRVDDIVRVSRQKNFREIFENSVKKLGYSPQLYVQPFRGSC